MRVGKTWLHGKRGSGVTKLRFPYDEERDGIDGYIEVSVAPADNDIFVELQTYDIMGDEDRGYSDIRLTIEETEELIAALNDCILRLRRGTN